MDIWDFMCRRGYYGVLILVPTSNIRILMPEVLAKAFQIVKLNSLVFISTNRYISIEISKSKQHDIWSEPIVSFCPCPIAFYCVIIKIIREKTSLVYFLINIGDILFIICMFTKQIRSFVHCILYRSSFLLFLLNNVLISYGNQYILINSKIKCT